MIHEEVTDPNILRQIGGKARLVRVTEEIEAMCNLPSIAEKAQTTKIKFTDQTDLRLDITSPDPQVTHAWGNVVRRLMMRPPLNITYARVGYYDDNIKLLFKDEENWQVLALNTLGYSPQLTLGVKEGLSYIRPAFEEEMDFIPRELEDKAALKKTMTQRLAAEFFYNPVGFLSRYKGGMPIFVNGLMTIDEFYECLELINDVRKSPAARWSYDQDSPKSQVMVVSDTELKGNGNPEGDSLLFLPDSGSPQEQWIFHEDILRVKYETRTPVLLFDGDKPEVVGATLVEKTYYCDNSGSIRGESVNFIHSSLIRYQSEISTSKVKRRIFASLSI